jgi:acyl-CoA synthetase (AMP-forming)/AMP-acid ligase II
MAKKENNMSFTFAITNYKGGVQGCAAGLGARRKPLGQVQPRTIGLTILVLSLCQSSGCRTGSTTWWNLSTKNLMKSSAAKSGNNLLGDNANSSLLLLFTNTKWEPRVQTWNQNETQKKNQILGKSFRSNKNFS